MEQRKAGCITRFVSGSLGNPDYEIDTLIPGNGAMVRVQLRTEEAWRFIGWHRPWMGVSPLSDFYDLDNPDESDSFLDLLIESIHAWVATFPLLEPLP